MPQKNNLTRRKFFKTAGTVGLGTVLGGACVNGVSTAQASAALVPTRPFGRTGVNVPILSLGTMWDTVNTQIVLHQAMKLGATYWDTAESYHGGFSEVGIGKYFQRFPGARQKVFLVTKGYSRDSANLGEMLDSSLSKLKTNYIDLYFVHAIRDSDEMTRELMAWGKKVKDQGKIRLFGFSTHSNMERCLLSGAKIKGIDGIMMTYNYRIMHNQNMKNAVEACTQAGIGLTAMKTQGGGPVGTNSEMELRFGGRFIQKGFTPEQAKMKAVWESPRIAAICSQMPNLAILNANAAAAMDRTKLSAADRRELKEFAALTGDCYCAGCSEICENAIKGPAPVAEVMRYLMYYQSHRDPVLAREMYASLPEAERHLLRQTDFSRAESVCPQGLPIARLMREADLLLA